MNLRTSISRPYCDHKAFDQILRKCFAYMFIVKQVFYVILDWYGSIFKMAPLNFEMIITIFLSETFKLFPWNAQIRLKPLRLVRCQNVIMFQLNRSLYETLEITWLLFKDRWLLLVNPHYFSITSLCYTNPYSITRISSFTINNDQLRNHHLCRFE